jgi:4-amino-4-deoxy-L-arabinose transferase-like glycosyltransferase
MATAAADFASASVPGGRSAAWLTAATAVVITAGVGGALALMWARFALGSGLLLLSVAAFHWPVSLWTAAPLPPLSRRFRRLALLAICTVAIFFRCYRLALPGIWGDDALNGLLAYDVLDGKIASPFTLISHAFSAFHALTNYTIAGAFLLFGAGPATLRVPGVIAGVLCVPLLYGTAAPLFGAPVALVAALFFASSPLQIMHSKVLIQVVLGELFQLCGLCLLVRGTAGKRRWLIAASGAPLALALCTYHSAKLAPAVAIVFFAFALYACRSHRRALFGWGVLGAVVFAACAAPGMLSYIRQPAALTSRIGNTALWPEIQASGSLWPLWDAVWRTVMIFHYQQGPKYHWLGPGFDPALNVILAFLFVHGLLQSLRHGSEPRHALLLAWFAIGLVPGMLSTEAPRVYRILLATPPLYVWAAMPVVQLYCAAAGAPAARRWVRGMVAALLVIVPLIDFNYHFYRTYTHAEFRWSNGERMVRMARTLKSLGRGWTGYLVSDSFNTEHETVAFLRRAWGLDLRDVGTFASVLPVHDSASGGAFFIFDRGNIEAAALLHALYPWVDTIVQDDPQPRTWWFDRSLPLTHADPPGAILAYFPISRSSADMIRGVETRFLTADGTPIGSRIDAQLGMERAQDLPDGTAHIAWSGAVYAPDDGTYGFALVSSGQATVSIDGIEVVTHDHPDAERPLAQGLHAITAEAAIAPDPVLRLQWQPPGHGTVETIASTLLFRDAHVHGLLATYESAGRTTRRIEPCPYYSFFPQTFADPFTARWRGHLQVPAPGGYTLAPEANAAVRLLIDGKPPVPAGLPEGTHDFEMSIGTVTGAARLKLYWTRPGGGRELVPPTAFTP